MKENQEDSTQESSEDTLDLSALNGINFGPAWTDKNSDQVLSNKSFDSKPRSKQKKISGKRDRRGPAGKVHRNGSKADKGQSEAGFARNKEGHRKWNESQRDSFQPTVSVNIYAQDDAFEALVNRLRSTVRTYELFEIANLILKKPDRFVLVVQNKAKTDEKLQPLYYSVPGHLPFETEDAAVNYVLNNHLDRFFDIEEIEVEPPKGNFQMVNRCSLTGELLGPPNYHRYQEFLQRHYAARISNMSFERFVSRVESVKEQESIDAWVESMKKGARYTLKEHKEGDPESFQSLEAVRSFLLKNRRDAIVGMSETVRFAGCDIKRLPKGAIRRSVESYIEHQLRFPLDTANNIRGRLRRYKFTVYKKGSKGISYVCAVKRKFRDSTTVFTSSIQQLIEFIEKNPDIPASKLSKLYLGIDIEKQNPAKLEMDESKTAEEQEGGETTLVQAIETSESAQTDAAATSVVEVMPSSAHGEEDLKQLNQLMLSLRWLVTEGYVTEYGNGHLFAPPPMPEPKSKKTDVKKPLEARAKVEPKKADVEESKAASSSDEMLNETADEITETVQAAPSEAEEKSS